MSAFPSQHKQITIDVYAAGGTQLVLTPELSSGFERLEALRPVSKWACVMQELTNEALRSFARRLLLNQILRVDNVTLVETVNVSEGYAFINIVYSCSGTTIIVADLTMFDGRLPPNTPAGRGFTRRRETDSFVPAKRCGTQLDACDPYADNPDINRNLLWGDGEMVSLCEFAKRTVVVDAVLGMPRGLGNAYVEATTRPAPETVTCLHDEAECMIATAAEFIEFVGPVILATNATIAVGSGRATKTMLALAERGCVPSVDTFAMGGADCLVNGPVCWSASGVKDVFGFDDGCLNAPLNTVKAGCLQAGLITIAMHHKGNEYVGGCLDDAPINTGNLLTLVRHSRGLGVTGAIGQDGDCVSLDPGEVLAHWASDGSAAWLRFQKPAADKVAGLSLSLS